MNYRVIGLYIVLLVSCSTEKKDTAEIIVSNNDTQKPLEYITPGFKEKEEKYFKIVSDDSSMFSNYYNLGHLYHQEALRLIKKADSTKYANLINDPNVYDLPLSAFFYEMDIEDWERSTFIMFDRALTYYEYSYKLNPNYPPTLNALKDCYQYVKNDVASHKITKKLNKLEPQL